MILVLGTYWLPLTIKIREYKGGLTMDVLHVTKENYKEEVLEEDKVVLLDFWAPWCGPCKMLSPVIDEIAKEEESIKVCKINVDEQSELASAYRVMSIPTLAVMQKGNLVTSSVGFKSKKDILKMLPAQ